MITPDTVSIVAREVRLEVYLNGVFYTGDSCFALDGKDVQLELEITDAIYDLLGFSGNQEIDVKLQVMTDDHISVSSCSPGEMHVQLETDENEHMSVCEVKDLQLEMNRNSISELKSPEPVSEDESDPVPAGASGEQALDDEENRSTELTTGQMTKNISAVFQGFCAAFQGKMANPVGEAEVDLIGPDGSYVPDPSVHEPESETYLVDSEQSCFTETDLVAPPEPKLDPVDPEESCVSPEENTSTMKNKKVHGFVMTKRTEYATVRNIKKISTFLQNDRPKHVGVSARPDLELNVPDPEPGENPDDPPEDDWDLAPPQESCAPAASVPEPESKVTSELSMLENYVPLNVFQLEDRLEKYTPLKQRHVTNVWPRVFIGDEEMATDRDALQEMCITHILNAAAPKKHLKYYLGRFNDEDMVGTVNTGSRYYRGLHINYYGLPTADRHCSDISKCFIPAAKFIDKALEKRASKVLICCKQGVEHSVTLFLAYLMICHDMMVEEAIDHVMKERRIRPSRDVLKKLMLLNADLVLQRKLKLQDIRTGRKRNKWQLKKRRALI
ncbi:uncharacterized protein LOC113041668 [Carassius auratus]|uniref:Uncharacterized protein LOC113041668 n=1 Tax=Carassius auratus TaxID=7957 RepID=A0A6P6J7B4_CARAU|nr:uncharacterized protein LOC113041668 [Carassius auratus]